MTRQVLYRKWRPQRFEEIVGQEHVVRTLQRALAAERVAHAYLFSGPRGTGKTSTARILAKAVNCTGEGTLPCNTCPTCLAINEGRAMDLIEIDAASNRGIDEIRDLRERVKFAPAEGRYKIYIIDESHMLTSEAFNALLKTLEEPPAHVIFVLATTEPHRIPATVLSRCQRFDFHRVRVADIVQRLEAIAQAEGLDASRPALELIARSATGSVRDAESLLDQLLVYGREGTLDIEAVQTLLGMRGSEQVANLVDALLAEDLSASLHLIQNLVDDGIDLRQFNRELVNYLRGVLFLAVTRDGSDLLDLTTERQEKMRRQAQQTNVRRLTAWVRRFSQLDADLKSGWYGQLPLELALVEALQPEEEPRPTANSSDKGAQGRRPAPSSRSRSRPREKRASRPESTPQQAAKPTPAEATETPAASRAAAPAERGEEPPAEEAAGEGVTLAQVQSIWPKVVDMTRAYDPSIQALLHPASCQPVAVEDKIIVLGFRYAFHKGKMEEVRNRRVVEGVLSQALKDNYGIRCILNEEASSSRNQRQEAINRQKAQRDPRVQAAANIFNAKIVDVESQE